MPLSAAKQREWRRSNPAKYAAQKTRRVRRQKERREAAAGRPQSETCEACGCTPGPNTPRGRGIVFDHDHATGAFRGWLCWSCNVALGLVGDNVERLLKLAIYLETRRCR